MSPALSDRFVGSLIGLATGDALGGPAEEVPGHLSPCPKPVTEMIGGGWLNLLPGQITDDTEMALCIARSLAEKEAFDPADISSRFVAWFYDSPIGAGGVTRAAMKRLRSGVQWHDASDNKKGRERASNGSVMRCAPVALYDYASLATLKRDTHTQGIITHRHPDCIGSCTFLNTLIAATLHGYRPPRAFSAALMSIRDHPDLAQHYQKIPSLTAWGISGGVRDTIDSAVNCYLTTSTFEDAVVKAVNAGGDADTRGAIVGAIAGARYGIAAIPWRWQEALVDRHNKPIANELEALALKLYSLSNPSK